MLVVCHVCARFCAAVWVGVGIGVGVGVVMVLVWLGCVTARARPCACARARCVVSGAGVVCVRCCCCWVLARVGVLWLWCLVVGLWYRGVCGLPRCGVWSCLVVVGLCCRVVLCGGVLLLMSGLMLMLMFRICV